MVPRRHKAADLLDELRSCNMSTGLVGGESAFYAFCLDPLGLFHPELSEKLRLPLSLHGEILHGLRQANVLPLGYLAY